MKCRILIALLFFFCISAYSFSSESKGVFIAVSLDSGYTIDGLLKGGIGGGGAIELKLLEKLSFVIDSGYLSYFKVENGSTNLITFTSVYLTARWYFKDAINGLYAGLGGGYFYTTYSALKGYGYALPLEFGIKINLFGNNGFFLEPNSMFVVKYINNSLFIDMKYGVLIGYSF